MRHHTTRIMTMTAVLVWFACTIGCSAEKAKGNIGGKLIVRLAYEDFEIPLGNSDGGIEKMHRLDSISERSGSNVRIFKKYSMSDDLKSFAMLEDSSKEVYLVNGAGKKLVYTSPSSVLTTPMISPDASFIAITEPRNTGSAKGGTDFVIKVLDLNSGAITEVSYGNDLKGNNLIVPGIVRWASDGSGFTFHRTDSQFGKKGPQICFYNMATGNITILEQGIEGLLSPRKTKIIYRTREDLHTARLTHLDSKLTFTHTFSENMIDYAWSPDERYVAFLSEGILGAKITITDSELRPLRTLKTGKKMMAWDVYFVPMRWTT